MFHFGVILICALFSCAGIQMVQEDAGVLQLKSFHPEKEEFLAVELNEQVDQQLSRLASVSGNSYGKLLAAVMLKKQFHPGKRIQEGEVLADMLGYERLNEPLFSNIVSYYERMFDSVEFLPVASVYSSQKNEILYDAEAHVMETEIAESGDFWLEIPMEEEWQGIVPVICMKTGTVIACGEGESVKNILCLEMENGVRILYGNLFEYLKDWQPGDQIESGEILGSAAGLIIQFQLQIEDGSWLSYNGLSCLKHEEKQVRPITKMLQ